MPRGDWPRGVDARPLAQPKKDAASASLESRGIDVGRTESSPPVLEIPREEGSGIRADLEEEKDGGCRSPQTGRHLT